MIHTKIIYSEGKRLYNQLAPMDGTKWKLFYNKETEKVQDVCLLAFGIEITDKQKERSDIFLWEQFGYRISNI